MKAKFQVVGEGSSDLMSKGEFEARFGDRFESPPLVVGFRAMLNAQPRVRGLAGPFYNGEKDGLPIVRYESWAAYEALSN